MERNYRNKQKTIYIHCRLVSYNYARTSLYTNILTYALMYVINESGCVNNLSAFYVYVLYYNYTS